MKHIISLSLCIVAISVLAGCVFPGDNVSGIAGADDLFFDDTVHHTIRIGIDPTILARMLLEHAEIHPDLDYRLANSFSFDGVKMDNIGIRGRGTTNLNTDKRSFKIAFNDTNPLNTAHEISYNARAPFPQYTNRSFYSVHALNLRSSTNDPSIIREMLSYWMYRENGVPAPRASTATLYINGQKWGVYIVVEQIELRFLQSRYADPTGNIYKCNYYESSGADFLAGSYNANRYQLRTNEDAGDTADIETFIQNLASVDNSSDFVQYVNLDNLHRYMAVSSMIGHWDSLHGNFNNDYVYHDPATGKWEVVVWDCDNTFGSDWMDNTVNLPYNLTNSDPNRSALFCIQASLHSIDDYKTLIGTLITKYETTDLLENEADRIRDMIKSEVQTNDPFLVDYDDFIDSFDNLPADAPFESGYISQYASGWGLKSYFKKRLAKIKTDYGL